MMRTVILLVFFLFGAISFAQETVIELKPVVRDDDNGKALSGATIEVYKNGSLFASESSNSSGKVPTIELPVCMGCTYTVKIKKSGYVTKTAIVDGHSDYPEELPPGAVVQKFEVSIFETVEGIDFSFLDREPMVEFAIDSYGMMNFDQQKIKVMKKKIEDLKKQMEKKKQELEKEAAEKAKMEADFNAYVKAGDAAMKKTDYEKAIGQYELALGIKPDDQPTKDKLEDAKIKLEELRANEEANAAFSAKMAEAKTAYANDELEKALGLYKEASGIKPNEQLPKDLIAEIEGKLAEQKKNEAAFNKLVSEGDAAVGSENYDEAISKYSQALDLKKDAGVQTKLDDAKKKKADQEKALAEEKANRDKYDQLIAKADAAFDTEKYDEAKSSYEAALQVFPNESKPGDRIKEIDEILKKRADEQAAKDKLEADYKKLMDEGKERIAQREWKDAKSKFEEALVLKPNDSDALAQIDLINKEMEKDAAAAKLDEEYNALMADAQSLMDQKKYNEAKSKFSQASGVKPQEQLPKDKVAEIERILADEAKAAELEEQYTKLMAEGDASNDRKEYTSALSSYKKALDLKPGDSAAQSKIDAINKILDEEKRLAEEQAKFDGFVAAAEQAFNAKDYDKAKLNYNNALGVKDDSDIRKRIEEIDAIIAENQSAAETQAKYDAAIKAADDLYNANDNAAALEKYKEALSIKEDNYPKGRISELTEKIAADEAAAAKEKEFNDLVAEADAAYDNKDYTAALSKYKEAIKVKPDPGISQKIGDLNVLLAEEAQNAEKREQYDNKIKEADAAFDDENWNGARSLYEEAGRILPTETYPDTQIEEIEKRMADESAAELERNYQKVIQKADGLLEDDKLDDAKTYYERASGFKPNDPYPKAQIEKIAQIKRDRENAAADEKRLNEQYDALIAEGEQSFNASNWPVALAKFQEALALKPAESYPQNRIAEIKGKMDAADRDKAVQAEYDGHIARADQLFNSQDYLEAIQAYNDALGVKPGEQYPKDRITSAENFLKLETENEEEAAYQKMLDAAQKNFDDKNYDKALDLYLRAKTTKPTDPFPQRRIDEINQIIAKAKGDEKLEEEYKALINDADNQYEKGEWKTAKDIYTKAYNIFNRTYPEQRIKECEEAMRQETDVTLQKNYEKLIKKADESFGKQNYDKAKGLYERALTFKPNDQYPKDQLLEIDKILNPNAYAKSKPNMRNWGDPNRSVNAIDVDAMLADAEEQRKYISSQKAEQQGIDAADAEHENVEDQTNATYDAREEVITMGADLEEAGVEADLERVEAAWSVDGMQVDLSDTDRDRVEGNDNDVQLQNQIVNNINLELDERDDEDDLPREAYLANVEEIRTEIIVENQLEDVDQTNATHDQRGYVEEFAENRIEGDPNMDVARKNTEVHVEDYNIQLINETNENVWDQEDVVMEVKEDTELEIDERAANDINRDIPRVEGVGLIEDETLDRVGVESSYQDDQYDVTIDQKSFTENMITEIELENVGNDIPRENMEDFVENQTIENSEAVEELTVDQNDVLFNTDIAVEDMEVEREENRTEDDRNREGYELTVEEIKEDKEDYLDEKTTESLDESHVTVDYLEDRSVDRSNDVEEADEKADDLIDNTSDAVDEMNEEKEELAEKSKEDLENSEDFVESLRDIKVDEIDEKMKNSLGDQFPEGVTEEIYTINDEDGLIVSYVVRRVVVRNGVGNVYEKVQTKFGTVSYTCNGNGISEYDWQDQTEAADLVRN